MSIANNSTAQTYDHLQRSIEWDTAPDAAQVEVLIAMKQLLTQAASHTPIFTEVWSGIERTRRSAWEQLDPINMRLSRLRGLHSPHRDMD
jgi:hypothetical protein